MVYEAIKDVIENGTYELSDILERIYVMYSRSKINIEQMEELETLAREKANIDNSIDVINKLKEIDSKMQEFDTRITKLENPSAEEPEEPEVTYPEFVKDKWYYNGDTCSENGKNYICIAPEGQVCVWSPSQYPAYWQEVIEESEETAEKVEDNSESEG